MELREIGINTRNWVYSAQDRDYSRAHVNAALIHGLREKITFRAILWTT